MKKITRFLFCTFVAIMLMGTAISATACHQKEEYPSVPEVTEPQPTGEIIPTVDRQKELKDARKKYSDAVAWLYMPGAEVDDPVVQAKDNAYYLQKDENGNYSEWGCYYAHCDNRLSSRSKLDRNTVIFGHSASNCDPDGPKAHEAPSVYGCGLCEGEPVCLPLGEGRGHGLPDHGLLHHGY